MTSSWGGYGPTAPVPAPAPSTSENKKRQLLSCTKCRDRKVKCDRTKPCSACCARGHPKECVFLVGEGNDYSPIQQSYELRKLRAENQQLKQKLQNAQHADSGDEEEDNISPDRKGRTSSRAATARQRRFKTGNNIDNLYFGTPGLANIVSDFANLHLGGESLTHTLPRGRDVYTLEPTAYPFPALVEFSSIQTLLKLLPNDDELFEYLEIFQRRAQPCSFPHTPQEVTKNEVQRFLEDRIRNADQFPDMLALLFVTLATGLQMGQYDRSGGEWVEGAVEMTRTHRSDVFLGASMQALRVASFMNRPTLLGIQTLIMMGPYLTNSGRFLDAWTLFGTTIRLAHSIGLHRNPKLLDPTPSLRECTLRRTLWWWMLHMDQQYSVTLGRPLGISGLGDCPPPQPLTTNPTMLRLSEFIDQFTTLARQILSSNEMLSVGAVDGYTDKLIALWDTMPAALQFTENWIQLTTQLPEWPLEVLSTILFTKVQSFLVILNRQRIERTQSSRSPSGAAETQAHTGWMDQQGANIHGIPEHIVGRAPQRGRPLVINSCVLQLQAFMFFYHRNKGVLICWTMGQQAFNACMILVLDAIETGNRQNEFWINQAYCVFEELYRKGVHKLAELAVQRISSGLITIENRKSERAQSVTMSRQSSSFQQQFATPLELDTASMTDLSGDSVMGNAGMFLLEDPGLQFYSPQVATFRPLEWIMAGSAHPSDPSAPPTPNIPSPIIPVSRITAAPFPVMSPPTIPVTNAPFAVGLQPRMPSSQRRMYHTRPGSAGQQTAHSQAAFTPINGTPSMQQVPVLDPFPQAHGHRQSLATASSSVGSSTPIGVGPRGSHRLDKPPRSHQRRK